MKVAFVSQWFDPEEGSAAIPGAMVRSLRGRGHDVEVITGFPNYPYGKLYDGYRIRPWRRETIRGVPVHRVPLYPSHDRSGLRRAINFLSFMLSASTIGVFIARRSRVALVYSTPATVGLAGLVLRRVFGKPFVLFVQDLWPDTVTATGMLPKRLVRPVSRILHAFCNAVYASAARIAVISPGMKDLLVSRGVPAEKIDIVYNWVDEDVFVPIQARHTDVAFQVMYAGNLGDVQGLDVAVRAMAELQDLPEVVLRLIGSGVAQEHLESLTRELGLTDRVRFEGPRPMAEIAGLMAEADVQLVCLSDHPLFHITMPSKIQATLACGQPLIVSAPGDAARLALESGAGFSSPAGDVGALADAIRRAYALRGEGLVEMGRKGRLFYERNLSARVSVGLLEEALCRAAHSKTHRGRRG